MTSAKIVAQTKSIYRRLGKSAVLRRNASGVYDVATGAVTQNVTDMPVQIMTDDVRAWVVNGVLQRTSSATMPATIKPLNDDLLLIAGEEWRVMNVEANSTPDGTVYEFKVTLA